MPLLTDLKNQTTSGFQFPPKFWLNPITILLLSLLALLALLVVILCVGYCIFDKLEQTRAKRNRQRWEERREAQRKRDEEWDLRFDRAIADASRRKITESSSRNANWLAYVSSNRADQGPIRSSRSGNVQDTPLSTLISANSSPKCSAKNCARTRTEKAARKAKINARRAARRKQLNKIPDKYVPALCEGIMDTTITLTKTGYTVLRCIPPAVRHVYNAATTVHNHLRGGPSSRPSYYVRPAPSPPPQTSSRAASPSRKKESKKEKKEPKKEDNKGWPTSTFHSTNNDNSNKKTWGSQPRKEVTELPATKAITECIYYEDDEHEFGSFNDWICKECFREDPRCQKVLRRPKPLGHTLPGSKFASRNDCPLCKDCEKIGEHDNYVCAGCLNFYLDIEKSLPTN
ncbi:Oidioi.mRNA.OKI2018_I69.PAR.g10243.t1.cds [Oikopleura dioica]|uniref:Oidioi.mRNA.OKI2018_I69.PAR.g10243.t1.cds n=1 Tax=Oikopleura dioica TaxID=34765 RepID=A0ABN7RUX9_OIKDI|nr:Oidioi.mRNA.OKI2018_I69.PAR.g10243.t1.cds [Oikopleura dioica]